MFYNIFHIILKVLQIAPRSASDQNRCTATRPTCQARSMVSRRPGEILLKHSCRSAHLRVNSLVTVH